MFTEQYTGYKDPKNRIPTIDENTTKNTLSSTTSLKYWRQYLLQKGKSKLSLTNAPPPRKQCCGANQATTEKKQSRGRGGGGQDCFAFLHIPHFTEIS